MRYLFVLVYATLVAFALFLLLWFIPEYTQDGFGFGLEPRTFPVMLTWILLLSLGYLLVKECVILYKHHKCCHEITYKNPFSYTLMKHYILCVGILCAIPFAISIGSFIPAVTCSLFMLQWICGRKKYVQMLATGLAIAIAEYTILFLCNIPI